VATATTQTATLEHQVDAAIKTIAERFGGVDMLINNAGRHLTGYNQLFAVLSRGDIRELCDVNVIGVVNCTLACRDSMRGRGGGVILNISSMAGFVSVTPYGVSKLAVRGLTVAFAYALSPDHIRVNGIAPGLMNTENALADLPPALAEDIVRERQLVHRLGATHPLNF